MQERQSKLQRHRGGDSACILSPPVYLIIAQIYVYNRRLEVLMRRSIRRQLQFLRAYALINSLALIVIAVAAFRQAEKPQTSGEINAQRINIVDANGTLRLVIANKDRMHPGVMDGKMIDRPRPVV